MTKKEAVRRALDELGRDAMPLRIKGFVKDRYGIEMSNDHVSVCKREILKEAGPANPPAAKPAAQPSAANKTGPKKVPAAGITKQEAVRRALAELGRDAKPTQMQGHIREHYGLEMTVGHISTAKGDILRKAKPAAAKPAQHAAARAGEPRKAEPTPSVRPAPAPQAKAIGLDDIEAVKGLLERVGAPALRRLIDVMAR
jgi:hypothetical protein